MISNPVRALDAIILTGGASRRMGQDKASQMWGPVRAVDHVAALARALGARRIVCAGPADLGYDFAPDSAPFSGPVAGVMAGLRRLGGDLDRVIVLAVDAPTLRPEDLAGLIAAPDPGAAFAGFPLPLVMAASAAPLDAQDDWPVRKWVERAGLRWLSPEAAALDRLRGANTPQDRDRLVRAEGWPDGPGSSAGEKPV